MRAKLHYLAIMTIMPIYGIQVCPFIESLSAIEVFVTFDVILVLIYFARGPLRARLVDRAPLAAQTLRVFTLELVLFASAALILMFYNTEVHHFPLVSGMKVLVGVTAMGFFASADLALEREREVAHRVERERLSLPLSGNFFPLSSKLALFAAGCVALLVGVFMLLVNKDLDWLVEVGSAIPLAEGRLSILKEFGFVLLVAMPETLNIIWSFSRNLNMFLMRENGVLACVTSGHYDMAVPVSSNDEFGVMAQHTNEMVRRIRERTEELQRTRDVTIMTLASLAETRDNETGAHILRTQRYVRALAIYLRDHPRRADVMDDETIDLLYKSAPLHDIGKVGIPDAILLKPGKLTEEEFTVMKDHPKIGAAALRVAEDELGGNSFLNYAREISLSHHEKWDGSGYPQGLKGEDIPLSGRLMAVADVYDALISKRVYKPAFSHQKAMAILREGRASHFDPVLIDALDAVEMAFCEIARAFRDEGQIDEDPALGHLAHSSR
ncbi:HD domain-containing phosphohydrolase [Varunaivibrio sulfuroxidans]|uniref:HD domain-containing protein n=1 Tax=Varunaivibrio sulfuroxidans TaxID=1773489 RepID=A0A4R3JGH7_9PROT|nr:HD domain-containing phosphohydrolase [Varunaivibrio sulfuroxidans]TCS65022.1 HD domain-containing protein [Varunaivibrio sulfuroxidans]WES29688.1 HD domain-containing protein [Varunaivibrio sulfuroxidans]